MLQIKEEFKNLIFKLKDSEYKELEKSCLEYGIRDAIVTWQGYIIDGHNRYEIAQKHNLDYKTIEMQFDSDNLVMLWMIHNQKSRRNLNDYQKGLLSKKQKEIEKKIGVLAMSEGGKLNKEGLSIIDKPLKKDNERHNTRNNISNELGWSTGKYAMFEVVEKRASEEQIEKLENNDATINQVYQEIKKQDKKEELEQIRLNIQKEVKKVDIEEIPETFDVIYADPPWRYDFAESSNRKIENHYTTMQTLDIAKMKVPAKENCVLFMWATAPKLLEALDVMKGWGFTYKTHAIWDKEKIGMGYWFRGQHELLMVGVKGKVSPPQATIRISSIIKEQRRKHSRKPDCVAEYIELAFYDKSKVELFCREPRNGWYSYGNQI